MAALIQFSQGIMNGNFGILFSIIHQSYSEMHRSRAYGYLGLSYGIGLSLSTLLSGITARPAKLYPSTFGHIQLFITYPFLLPCLISAVYVTVVWFTTAFMLPNPKKNQIKVDPNEAKVPTEATLLIQNDSPSDHYSPATELWTPLTVLLILSMFLHWWCMFAFMQMLGVWTSLPVESGGLEFSSLEIGFFFASWGFYLLPYYKLIWPQMISMKEPISAWTVIRIGLSLDVIHFITYPFLNAIAHHRVVMWIVVELLILLGVIAVNTYYLAVQILINSSVIFELNGSINGLVTTALAFGRAIAPFTAGLLFSWSLTNTTAPFDFHLLFFVIAFAQFIILMLSVIATHINPSTYKIKIS